jgi:hypothetical protein
MTIEIQERIEGKRGCGYRKPGGIYLVGPPTGQSCCKLPFPLTVCPCCGAGIKPARSWTWINCEEFLVNGDCKYEYSVENILQSPCPMKKPQELGQAGLLWIGEAFYKTPEEFLSEAKEQGISRRISTVPKGFEPGKTWVLLAHRKACVADVDGEQDFGPGIFSVFKPSAIEYVTTGNETEDDLERLAKRGLTPVVVRNRVAQ